MLIDILFATYITIEVLSNRQFTDKYAYSGNREDPPYVMIHYQL